MRIFKPSGTSFWQYEFVPNGKRYHKSTKMTNEREALKIANAAFTALVKGEAGIGEPKSVPTLRAFRQDFVTAVQAEKQDKPKTVQFYTYSFDSLLKYEPLAEARLDNIDERLVQSSRSGRSHAAAKRMKSAPVALPRSTDGELPCAKLFVWHGAGRLSRTCPKSRD
jgi:hypothetical protein